MSERSPADVERPKNPYMDGSAGKRLLVAAVILGLLVLATGAWRVVP